MLGCYQHVVHDSTNTSNAAASETVVNDADVTRVTLSQSCRSTLQNVTLT